MIPRRPLRSVLLGNPRYLSVYALGVQQAMGLRGDWHRNLSIFDDASEIRRQLDEMQPDVIWTHMVLWPPAGARTAVELCEILATWKRRGAAVFLHDGDPRAREIGDVDIGAAFTHALVNRTVVTWPSPIDCLHWPYAAMVQREPAAPSTEWTRDLVFAGILRSDGLYGERTRLVQELQRALGPRMRVVSPGGGDLNNRMLVPEVAASAGAVLGFARPEVKGWIDTRVFQYPGAGGVLIHDDAGVFLQPEEHYLQFDRKKPVESILWLVDRAKNDGPAIRERAFAHVQKHHTWVQRVEQALQAHYGRG